MSLELLDQLARDGFEEISAVYHRPSNLRAFVALHDTSPGCAFGGTRRWSYFDERAALRDCLRLARAMTYKCALADLPAGGGKLVVLDRSNLDIDAAFEHLGRLIERMAGRFYSGPDVGTGERELAALARHTAFVTDPGPAGPGELPESTAAGVFAGIEAALAHLDGAADWARRTLVVQGLGEVGSRVARRLLECGARVLAAETDPGRADQVASQLELELIDPASEYDQPCDVFVPCALGGILHDLTLTRLRCRIVAGGANNVLARALHGDRLHERGILYVPDFVINAGALIRGATFHLQNKREAVATIELRVGASVARVLRMSVEENMPPARVAVREAERRLDQAHVGDGAADEDTL